MIVIRVDQETSQRPSVVPLLGVWIVHGDYMDIVYKNTHTKNYVPRITYQELYGCSFPGVRSLFKEFHKGTEHQLRILKITYNLHCSLHCISSDISFFSNMLERKEIKAIGSQCSRFFMSLTLSLSSFHILTHPFSLSLPFFPLYTSVFISFFFGSWKK